MTSNNIILNNNFNKGDPKDAKIKAETPSILQSLHNLNSFPPDFESWNLNNSQSNVIKLCLNRSLSLIQGPPGTGKTHTIIQLIKLLCYLYRGTGITILACAYTNVATDHLLEGCLNEGLSALRLGRPTKIRTKLRNATLEAKIEQSPKKTLLDSWRHKILNGEVNNAEFKSLREDIKDTEKSIVKDIFQKAQVVCSTCIFAADDILRGIYFPILIIDESSQANEPSSIVPIVSSCAQQVILVGDHHQLPPTVKSDLARKKGFDVSLFSRLISELDLDVWMLETQYRMHPNISEFPSFHFYEGKIQNDANCKKLALMPGFNWPQKYHVAFLHSGAYGENKTTKDYGKSWENLNEAKQVVKTVKSILNNSNTKPEQIGIITPYKAQANLISSLLDNALCDYEAPIDENNLDSSKILTSTIDAFQGREKDLILFSSVRSNKSKKIGFLKDWRRLNVSLTRAKRGFIVFGNKDTLSSDIHWKSWIEWAESKNILIDYSKTKPKKNSNLNGVPLIQKVPIISHVALNPTSSLISLEEKPKDIIMIDSD